MIIHSAKPSIIYDNDGSFLSLGIGYTNKTIFPIWVVTIILAILTYVGVMFFINRMPDE
jgi:hypothetical protein